MSLLNQTTQISAKLLEIIKAESNHLISAANLHNSLSSALLGLSDEALSSWLNNNKQILEGLFTDHAVTGTILNQALEKIALTLKSSGVKLAGIRADVRPFGEKLAGQNRVFSVLENGNFLITTAEPEQPEEPENEGGNN